MNEFNAKDLMELERQKTRFSNNIPTLREIDTVINALSIVEKLQGELIKLKRECYDYTIQISELKKESQEPGKNRYSYLKIFLFAYFTIIVLIFAMFMVFGFEFLEILGIPGAVLCILGLASGFLGIIIKRKGNSLRNNSESNTSRLSELQEKLGVAQQSANKIKETTLQVEQMAANLLEKYDEPVGRDSYMDRLVRLRNDVDEYRKLMNIQD